MTLLSDTFFLKRASGYSAPLNGNERLPVVYGDLTDGTNGIWRLPCLKSTDDVYCFAGHEVMADTPEPYPSVVGLVIYEDGQALDPSQYVFNAANNYEGHGVIATIDFATPKSNAAITAKGRGKPITPGSATLMDNIIDIVNDFLTVENDFTSSLFASSYKARASQIFAAQSYRAAGVIDQDGVILDIIAAMMASFLGSAYLNGSGNLVLDIDAGTISQSGAAGFIRKSDTYLVEARQRLVNIINQCPAHYAYSYARGEFRSETNDSAHADAASQGIYGVREPNTPYQFYWCRDLANVQKIQDIIVAKFKHPVYEIEIADITMKHPQIDAGDVFVYSLDSLYDRSGFQLLNHFWRCISAAPDFQRGKINFRALQTNFYLVFAYLADGSHLADGSITAGNERDVTAY